MHDAQNDASVPRPVVVITGGASGIGLAVARLVLGNDEHALCAIADRNEGGCMELARTSNGRVHYLPCDVTDQGEISTCADRARELGVPVGLVNCAGIVMAATSSLDLSLTDFRRMMAVHVEGTLAWCQTLARIWVRDSLPGSIVNISSIAARFAWPGRLPYAAAKVAIESITRTLAVEWAGHEIRVNAVAPGYVDSPLLTTNRPPDSGLPTLDEVASMHALGRVAQPAEIAAAIAWLLSDDASFVTGEVLLVDGGYSIKRR